MRRQLAASGVPEHSLCCGACRTLQDGIGTHMRLSRCKRVRVRRARCVPRPPRTRTMLFAPSEHTRPRGDWARATVPTSGLYVNRVVARMQSMLAGSACGGSCVCPVNAHCLLNGAHEVCVGLERANWGNGHVSQGSRRCTEGVRRGRGGRYGAASRTMHGTMA